MPQTTEPFETLTPGHVSPNAVALARTRRASVFAWIVLALMAVSAFAFVGAFGSNVPLWDEWWGMIPALAGYETDMPAWLWRVHNNHRVPLAKLILYFIHKVSGYDFRVAMVFNVAAAAVMAGAMMLVAKRRRGSTSYLDVFFPLVLLHWGHWASFLWAWQAAYLISMVAACALLCVIADSRFPLNRRSTIFAGLCLMALPLIGAQGLLLAPFLGLWFLYSAFRQWRSHDVENRLNALLSAGFIAVTLLFAALYFRNYNHENAGSPNLWATLRIAAQFLTISFGSAVSSFWPFSVAGLMGLAAIVLGHLYKVWRGFPEDRARVAGLVLFAGGMLTIALAIGAGRANWDYDRGLFPHYTFLAVPLLCCLYFLGILQSPGTKLVQGGLVLLTVILLPFNVSDGLHSARQMHSRMQLFEQDVDRGIPIFILDERHADFLNPWRGQVTFSNRLKMLRGTGGGRFRSLQADPVFSEVSVLDKQIETEPTGKMDSIPAAFTRHSEMVFPLKSQFVYAIRVRYSYGDPEEGPAVMKAVWKMTKNDPVELQRSGNSSIEVETGVVPIVSIHPHNSSGLWLPDTPIIPRLAWTLEKTETFWVNDTIDEFRIYPDDMPRLFGARDVTLLVPKK